MRIKLFLNGTSQPLEFEATNTYTKDGLYCIQKDDKVHKFPVDHIWQSVEDYGVHSR